MKHISCLLPAIALVLAACGRAPEPQQTSAPKGVTQSSLVAQGESATPAIVGPCPFQWTCDHQRWYSTQSACTSQCGSCFLEEHDNGHCIPR